jgi:hypothetical protein
LTIDTLGPSLPWAARWTEAEAAGIWALPTSPQRESTNLFVADGWSVVLEIANGATYHISGADNPQVFCSADDRQIVTVIDILLPTVAWHCRQAP